MNIPGINTTSTTYNMIRAGQAEEAKAAKPAETAAQTEDVAAAKAVEQNADKYVKSTGKENSVTYTRPNAQKMSASQLMQLEQQRTSSFTQMLQSMVVRQGQKSNLTLFGMNLNVTQAQSAEAAKAIGEGGEYSVDAVAGRIMDMAKALAGGDESKISLLRTAVEKGFKAAGVELGGKLPSISQDTHTEVMKRFDEWEKEGKTTVDA